MFDFLKKIRHRSVKQDDAIDIELQPVCYPGDWSYYEDLDTMDTFDRDSYEAFSDVDCYSGRRQVTVFRITVISVVILILACITAYLGGMIHYTFHFYPNSMLNDLDVSGMTGTEVKGLLQRDLDEYTLTVRLREGDFVLTGDEIGLTVSLEPEPHTLILQQDLDFWPLKMFRTHIYQSALSVDFNEMKAVNQIAVHFTELGSGMDASSPSLTQEADGSLTYSDGKLSTHHNAAECRDLIFDAIRNQVSFIDLRETDAYQDPYELEHDAELSAFADAWNHMLNADFSYEIKDGYSFIDKAELLDHMQYEGVKAEIQKTYLLELAAQWLNTDLILSEPLYYHGVLVDDAERSAAVDAYLERVVMKLLSDLASGVTDGVLPSFDPEMDLSASGSSSLETDEEWLEIPFDLNQ